MFNTKRLKEVCVEKTENILEGKDFLFIDNGKKVLGVAHADTVFRDEDLFFFRERNIIFSPGLDDRLGVYILLEIYGKKLDILITDDEEKVRSTAINFTPNKKYNWMVEFDRYHTDVVTYQYAWKKEFLKKYFLSVGYGNYSDIADLEHLNCQGINLGIGYYDAHKINCYADLNKTQENLRRFDRFLEDNYEKRFQLHLENSRNYLTEKVYFPPIKGKKKMHVVHYCPECGNKIETKEDKESYEKYGICSECASGESFYNNFRCLHCGKIIKTEEDIQCYNEYSLCVDCYDFFYEY